MNKRVVFLAAAAFLFQAASGEAQNRKISGTVVGVDCGESTSFTMRTSSGGKVSGAYFER